MTVAELVPDDAPSLLALSREWGNRTWQFLGGNRGIVARDADGVAGFALFREEPFGIVADELWSYPNRRGRSAWLALYQWLEKAAESKARAIGAPVGIGGMVHLINPKMEAALKKRGYKVVAQILAKEISA